MVNMDKERMCCILKIMDDNRGVTLIELMLSMSLLVIVTGCLIMLMSSASKGYARGDAQVRIQEEAQDTANYLTDAVLCANNADVVSSASVTGIILHSYAADASGTVDYTKSSAKAFVFAGDKVYFYSSNSSDHSTLVSTVNNIVGGSTTPDEANILCTNVEKFDVSYSEPTVKFSLELKIGNPKTEYKVGNSVAMRNMIVEP